MKAVGKARRRGRVSRYIVCLARGFRRDPRLAFQLAAGLRLNRRSWQRFSLQTGGKELLRKFYEASRETGVRPFLMWGTLLGYVRERRLLLHDKDIDVAIFGADYSKRDSLIAALERRGFVLREDRPHKLSFWGDDGILHIDIDVIYPWEGRMICTTIDPDEGLIGAWFPEASFGDLREVVFLGDISVLIPEFPELVLETIYGDWRTPVSAYNSRVGLLNRFHVPKGSPMPEPLAG
jgi:hypothetical protein